MGGPSKSAPVIQRVIQFVEKPTPKPVVVKDKKKGKKGSREETRKSGGRGVLTSATLGRPSLTSGKDTLG